MTELPFAAKFYNGSGDDVINGSDVTSGYGVTTQRSGRPYGGGGGSGRPGGRYANVVCGYCDTSCVYNSIEMGFVIGVLANFVVLGRVYRDKKLHDTTFTAIACLAFADACFLTINLVRSFDDVSLKISCGYPSKVVTRPFYVLQSIMWFAANSHVSLMAILRYISIAYPLRSSILLSWKRVLVMSGFIWFLGFILMGTVSLLITYGYILAGRSREFVIILWGIVYLTPLCVTIILHILKMFVVKQSTRETATESTKRAIRRMTKIVFMVITFAMILPLPRLINKFIRVAGPKNAYPSPEFGTHYSGISDLLFLINHFINPFMYAFLSKKFRNSLKEMVWCLKIRRSDDSSTNSKDTQDTPVSSQRRNISLDPISPIANSNGSLDTLDQKL